MVAAVVSSTVLCSRARRYARSCSPVISAMGSWLAAHPARAQAIHTCGAHSMLVTPLALRSTVLGLACLYRTAQPDPFDEDDVSLVRELADHAAVHLDWSTWSDD